MSTTQPRRLASLHLKCTAFCTHPCPYEKHGYFPQAETPTPSAFTLSYRQERQKELEREHKHKRWEHEYYKNTAQIAGLEFDFWWKSLTAREHVAVLNLETEQVAALVQAATSVSATTPAIPDAPSSGRRRYQHQIPRIYENGLADQEQKREQWHESNERRRRKIEELPDDEKAAYKAKRAEYYRLQYRRKRAYASEEAKERNRRRQNKEAKHRRNQARINVAQQCDMDLRALQQVSPTPTICGENSARIFSVNSWKTGLSLTFAHICNRLAAGFGPKIVAISESYLDVDFVVHGWTFMQTRAYDNAKGSSMTRLVVGYNHGDLGERIIHSSSTKHTISLFIAEPRGTTPHLQLLFAYLPPKKNGDKAIYRQATMELIAEIDKAEYPLIVIGDLNARMGKAVGDAFRCPCGRILCKLTEDRGFDILNKEPHTKNVPTYSKNARKKPANVAPGSSIIDYGLVQKCIADSVSGFHLIDTFKKKETYTTSRIHSDHRALELILALPTSTK
ncbi:hypothetical protein GGI01_001196 [Coemansia sp. RSA 376]|nr:hypothetical protein GGI01_001196 [Coemansia sp. RSA 376]KAJ2431639.1 hypothetical protein GGF41_000451 [Coemansia sp. RSA 2531]